MKIAIFGDIHSNVYALDAVLSDIESRSIDQYIITGDIFGYYPWAVDTYDKLKPILSRSTCIKGNHDQLVLDTNPPDPVPSYWSAAKNNEEVLSAGKPEAIAWLQKLDYQFCFNSDHQKITVVHGTPENPANGRFYPDHQTEESWFPLTNEVLIMGHTHYPIYKKTSSGGVIINPGSVGQPRDGNPMPCWVEWDTNDLNITFHRTNYPNMEAMQELENMQWDDRSIRALNKLNKGQL